MFDTGVEKTHFNIGNKLPEELRHLMHEGVHIEQAVLKRRAIG